MLLGDDTAYERCVTAPERCLRAELRRIGSRTERDTLLYDQGAYGCERSPACLQRAGEANAAREPALDLPEANPAELDAAYREWVLLHLVGNMKPVALLNLTNFFGDEMPQDCTFAPPDRRTGR